MKEIHLMEPQRLRGIVTFSAVLALLLFFPLSEFLYYRSPTREELVGFGGGLVIGGLICWYLNGLWDPIRMQPLRPDSGYRPWWIRYALPIAVFLAGTIGPTMILLFGKATANSLGMGGVGVAATFLGYFIVRLW